MRIFSKEFNETKVAFLNYVQSTNLDDSPYILDESEYYLVNLLMPQFFLGTREPRTARQKIVKRIKTSIPAKNYLKLRKTFHLPYVNKFTDRLDPNNMNDTYISRIRSDMTIAKDENDIVIVCLHLGGQFNETPGERTQYFVRLFSEMGADYIINTHPHVVQGTANIDSTFVAYCLGNFSISPSSVYVPKELRPEYSIALHLYIEDDQKQKLTFSILKILEDKKHKIRVIPVDELADNLEKEDKRLLEQDVTFIYNRFLGKDELDIPIKREYEI